MNNTDITMNKEFEEEVERTVSFLKAGKTILYPTDTIWGVGCDATNSKACDRIYELKHRPEHKSLIVLVDSAERLKDYVVDVPAIAYDLIAHASKPLSIVFAQSKNLAKNVSADKSVCIRGQHVLPRGHTPFGEAHHLHFGQPLRAAYRNDLQ